MTLPNALLAYSDCLEVFDRALADEKGIRVPMSDQQAARRFQARLHQARTLDRDKNRQTYEPGMKMYGASVYDELVVRIVRSSGKHYVYVEQVNVPGGIESLSDVVEEPEPEAPPLSAVVDAIRRR